MQLEYTETSEKPVDTFPYGIVFGVWTTWMLTLSILLLNKYVFSAPSGFASKSPYVYWAITAWTITPLWLFTWGVWLWNIITDNKGGKTHKFFSMITIFYMAIPVVLQPIFLIINVFAARDAPDFWLWWSILFVSDLLNLVLFYFTVLGLQMEYINAETAAKEATKKKCYDEDGVEMDCLKQVLAQIAAEQAAEQAEKDAAVAACTENCEAVIAAAEPPKKWYTFEMFRTTAKFFNLNQDEFMKDLDTNTKLEIYGLGKQGAKGDNTTEEPFFLDIKESLKWKAWMGKKGMSQEDAQDQFMTLMKALGFY